MRIQISADATEETNGFKPFPEGEYTLQVVNYKDTKTKDGNRQMVVLEFEVVGGDHAGRKIWHNLTFIPKGEPGHGFTLHALHALGMPYDGDLDFDTSEFQGRSCKAQVTIEEYGGKERNKIADFITEEDGHPGLTQKSGTKPKDVKEKKKITNEVPF